MGSINVRIATDADHDAFNAFASAVDSGDLLQSWEWGRIKAESGWRPRRYLAERDGQILASVSVLETAPFRGVPPLLYAPRGPLFTDAAAVAPLLQAIRRDARGAFMLKADPAVEAGSSQARALREAGFRTAGGTGFGGVQPKAVMVLDIDRSEEEILAGFKQKWRYNIRLAERKGVTVQQSGPVALAGFYRLLVETAKRDGFFVRGRTYFQTLFDTLQPRDMLSLWMTWFEGKPIAGAMCFHFGRRVTYVYGASSNDHRNVMPNHLMQWEMIREARKRGAAVYDFRGVSPLRDGKPAEGHIAGLNRFKEGFGARYVEYPGDMDLPLRPVVYRAWVSGAPVAMRLYKKLKGGSGSAGDPA